VSAFIQRYALHYPCLVWKRISSHLIQVTQGSNGPLIKRGDNKGGVLNLYSVVEICLSKINIPVNIPKIYIDIPKRRHFNASYACFSKL